MRSGPTSSRTTKYSRSSTVSRSIRTRSIRSQSRRRPLDAPSGPPRSLIPWLTFEKRGDSAQSEKRQDGDDDDDKAHDVDDVVHEIFSWLRVGSKCLPEATAALQSSSLYGSALCAPAYLTTIVRLPKKTSEALRFAQLPDEADDLVQLEAGLFAGRLGLLHKIKGAAFGEQKSGRT